MSKKYIQAFCSKPHNLVKVSSDGNVNMCCHQNTNYLGNLFEKPFEDIWFSNFAEDVRNQTKNNKLHPMCDTKECPFKYKNLIQESKTIEADARGYPIHLEFDLHGSHCNFGGTDPNPENCCIMCPRSRIDFKQHLLLNPDRTDELIEKIKHIIPNLEIINILGIAEPFWKGKIFEILEKINFSKYQEQISLWTTSNASVFNEEQQEKLLKITKKTDIHFSLDAASDETFFKIRRNHSFKTCCKNIKNWCKKRNSSGEHYVRLHNNINMLNVHEVSDMVLMAKDMQVDLLVLIPTHDCGGTHSAIKDIIVNQNNFYKFKKAEKDAVKLANKINQNIFFSRPLALNFELKIL
jgi:MoaA/NifB/PqqE/SkfB family radical SAM enzyme